MTVYVVRYDHSDYGQGIVGVYASEKDAIAAIEEDNAARFSDDVVPRNLEWDIDKQDMPLYGDYIIATDKIAENYWYVSVHKVQHER